MDNPGTFVGTFSFNCEVEKHRYYIDSFNLKGSPDEMEILFEDFCNDLREILHRNNPDSRIIIKPLQYEIYPNQKLLKHE